MLRHATPLLHLNPLFGTMLTISILGERPQLFHLAGYALVLRDIAIATRRYRIA